MRILLHGIIAIFVLAPLPALAGTIQVNIKGADGKALHPAMITVRPIDRPAMDQSDDTYPEPLVEHPNYVEFTAFSDADGNATLHTNYASPATLRVRLPGFRDFHLGPISVSDTVSVTLEQETDPIALAAAKPANVWAHAIDLGDPDRKKRFQMQCGFCHQQGSLFIRLPRTKEVWDDVIGRMIGYGARLPTSDQKVVSQMLVDEYARLNADPSVLAEPRPWSAELSKTTIREIPAGDMYSQMHDMYLHPTNGNMYIGDNLQDRLWEMDTESGAFTIYKTPHKEDDVLGGLIRARLKTFPKHLDYTALHSMAASTVDGHIFMTPSNQRRLLEFDPESKQWWSHEIGGGFYPHTVRVDQKDRVWFTLALSNQVAMFDRSTKKFKLFDLPSRSFRESLTIWAIPKLFWMAAEWGLPLSKFPIDEISTGVPLPYGIDIGIDGKVYVARLHANDIIEIDPETDAIESFEFPLMGPRRLRTDAVGNLWIGAFAEGAVVQFDPKTRSFTTVDMPTLPKGSDTPYSLAVDKERQILWVTGTGSDTLNAYHINEKRWTVFPMPRKMTFTREVDVAEDGSIYSSNGAFPPWHIEDSQPTLIHVIPPWQSHAHE